MVGGVNFGLVVIVERQRTIDDNLITHANLVGGGETLVVEVVATIDIELRVVGCTIIRDVVFCIALREVNLLNLRDNALCIDGRIGVCQGVDDVECANYIIGRGLCTRTATSKFAIVITAIVITAIVVAIVVTVVVAIVVTVVVTIVITIVITIVVATCIATAIRSCLLAYKYVPRGGLASHLGGNNNLCVARLVGVVFGVGKEYASRAFVVALGGGEPLCRGGYTPFGVALHLEHKGAAGGFECLGVDVHREGVLPLGLGNLIAGGKECQCYQEYVCEFLHCGMFF